LDNAPRFVFSLRFDSASVLAEPISHDLWTNVVQVIDFLGQHWREPDESPS
jgi:hypothetical protein